MKRFFLIALASLGLLFGSLWAWMRLGLLFPLPPSSSAVAAGGELERMFGAVPPPRFRVLRYREVLQIPRGDRRTIEKTTTVRLVESAGWRSVVYRQVSVPGFSMKPGTYFVGPVGLFNAADGREARRGERYLSRVGRVRGVKGSLFPLAPGKRLEFTADFEGQAWMGPLRLRQGSTLRQAFEVVGTTARWPSIPGPVFVIVRSSSVHIPSLGWKASGRQELHYAPALGAVVFEHKEPHDLDGRPRVQEIQLVEWR